MDETIVELFTHSTSAPDVSWSDVIAAQECRYLGRKCIKTRKSNPEISIGTCSVRYGVQQSRDIVICPQRLLERGQVFLDCLHLITLHEPGNELHIVPEVEIPGGSIDYFLVSVYQQKIVDFVGVELQALDTTGSVWGARQAFLASKGVSFEDSRSTDSSFGMNWKMTAKTTLVQLHHKIETFEALGKHLVLVLQDHLLNYMQREFEFEQVQGAKIGHAMHFHAYTLQARENHYMLTLSQRLSTDTNGVALALGLKASSHIELETLREILHRKISPQTRFIL